MTSTDKKGDVRYTSDTISRYTPKQWLEIFYDIDEIAVVQDPLEGMLVNCLNTTDLFNLSYDKIKPGDLSRDVIYYSRKEDEVQHLDRFYGYIDKEDPDISIKASDEFIANAIKSRAEKLGVNIMYFPSHQIIRESGDDEGLIERIIGIE